MKFKFIFLFIILSIFLFSFVSAEVSELNRFRYGIIKADGSFNPTSNTINNVSAIGFICSNQDCSQVSSRLFEGTLNSGTSSSMTLKYPTQLQGEGYGIIFFKEGYIPFGLKSTYSGNGSAPDRIDYLTKKEGCISTISSLDAVRSGNKIIISSNVQSPFLKSGLLNLFPDEISSYYKGNVLLNLTIKGAQNLSSSKSILIYASSTSQESFDIPFSPGDYTFTLTSDVSDSKCISSVKQTKTLVRTFASEQDTTPPNSISNLQLESKTTTSLKWKWDNPSDSDFSQSLVFLDNVNILNTTLEFFIATDLSPNSTHTIKVLTKDLSGNINENPVSNTATTLSNQGIACNSNSDCGSPSVSEFMCLNSSTRSFLITTPTCNLPGTESSFCSSQTAIQTQSCSNGCSNGQCLNGPGMCNSHLECADNNSLTLDECINPGTNASICRNTPINCASHSDCLISNFTEDIFCSDKDVFKTAQNPVCTNPGTTNSTCAGSSIIQVFVKSCQFMCTEGQCVSSISCNSNSDCDDNNSETIDICHFPGTESSSCSNEPRMKSKGAGSSDYGNLTYGLYSELGQSNKLDNLFNQTEKIILNTNSNSNPDGEYGFELSKDYTIPLSVMIALVILTILTIIIALFKK